MGIDIQIQKAVIVEVKKSVPKWTSEILRVERITLENLEDCKWFNDEFTITKFKEFLKVGHIGFFCYKGDICIFRTWILINSDNTFVGNNFIYQLAENEVFSGWSETAVQYRGFGAFSFTLNQIIYELTNLNISAYIAYDNIASIKGTEKTGFEITKRLILIKFYRLRCKIQFTTKNNRRVLRLGFSHKISK